MMVDDFVLRFVDSRGDWQNFRLVRRGGESGKRIWQLGWKPTARRFADTDDYGHLARTLPDVLQWVSEQVACSRPDQITRVPFLRNAGSIPARMQDRHKQHDDEIITFLKKEISRRMGGRTHTLSDWEFDFVQDIVQAATSLSPKQRELAEKLRVKLTRQDRSF